MYLILLCFGTLFGLGAFFLLAGLLRLPTSASTKAVLTVTSRGKSQKGSINAVLTVTSRGKSQKGSINAVLFDMAARLSPLVHLDGYKRKKLEAQLKSAEIKMSPETYIAAAWVKAGLIALLIIPALLILGKGWADCSADYPGPSDFPDPCAGHCVSGGGSLLQRAETSGRDRSTAPGRNRSRAAQICTRSFSSAGKKSRPSCPDL